MNNPITPDPFDHNRSAPACAQRQPAPGYAPTFYPPAPSQQPGAPVQQVVALGGGYQRPRCRHGLHFILTVLTGGLWGIVWIIDAIVKGK